MKNLILLLAVIFISACGVHKKQNTSIENNQLKRYKSLDKFNGDTLAFVQYSILDRKQFYIGKELGVMLKDLTIPINVYSGSNMVNDVTVTDHIYLDMFNYSVQEEKLAKGIDPISLAIVWQKPIDFKKFYEISKRNLYHWTPEVEQYLSKQIVGNIIKTKYKGIK